MSYLAAAASIEEAAALISALAAMGDSDFAANLDQAAATLEDAVAGASGAQQAGVARAAAALARRLGVDMDAAIAAGQDAFELRSTAIQALSGGLVAARAALEAIPHQIPAAVSQLLTANLCAPQSAPLVCAAQQALGITPDGKYGEGTAALVRTLLPNAPGACSPRPAWWRPAGESNCGLVSPTPPGPPAPITPVPPSTTPSTTKKGISTGAIVGSGLLALVVLGTGLYLARDESIGRAMREARRPRRRKRRR